MERAMSADSRGQQPINREPIEGIKAGLPLAKNFQVLLIVAIVLDLALTGCGKISGGVTNASGPTLTSVLDFKNTEIIANGPIAADGSSELSVIIHLKNSDNSSVPGYRPTYQVTSSVGVSAGECTQSDNNGISVCILKSTQAGAKVMRLTNALVGLEHALEFLPSKKAGRLIGLVPGHRGMSTTSSEAKVELSAGDAVQGIRRTTQTGYVVHFSVQGGLVSQ